MAQTLPEQDIEKLRHLAEDVCRRENCRLYDLELVGGGSNRTLRVFIDRVQQAETVTLDDCANVSNGLSLHLDVEDLVPGGKYNLEVSSPGVERKLTQNWHFETVVGKNVRVSLKRPLADIVDQELLGNEVPAKWKKQRQVEAVVSSSEGENVVLNIDGESAALPITEIEKARAVVEFTKGDTRKKNTDSKKTKSVKKKR